MTLEQLEALPISIVYCGVKKNCDWEHDAWTVHYNGVFLADYRTGLGLRVSNKPVEPSKLDVMDCLINESKSLDMSFADWCDCYGYDDNSIADRKIYDATVETGLTLTQLIDSETLAEIKDYITVETTE